MTERKTYRGPQPLGESLQQVVRPVFEARGFAEAKLIADWNKVVGEELAGLCTPMKVAFAGDQATDGTLWVHVSGANALEIQHLEPVILERMATFLGYCAISRLKLIQQ